MSRPNFSFGLKSSVISTSTPGTPIYNQQQKTYQIRLSVGSNKSGFNKLKRYSNNMAPGCYQSPCPSNANLYCNCNGTLVASSCGGCPPPFNCLLGVINGQQVAYCVDSCGGTPCSDAQNCNC